VAAKKLNDGTFAAKRLRVLVVDDQDAVREVVADTIRYAGHEVVAAARDGAEAVQNAQELKPDLVVMDIAMPRMNGVEAMRAIMGAGNARWVMLISGEYRSLGLTKEDISNSGAAAFLEKPFDVNRFLELLEGWAAEL
jgi:CheY-like chemotaxis protein